METWQMWLIVGIALLIIEMFTPMMFFASIGIGCFAAGFAAYLGLDTFGQIFALGVSSIVLIVLIRPLVMSKIKNGKTQTGVSRYIGKTAKVIGHISNSENQGRVKLFDEEWTARSENGEDIEVGENVEIIRLQDMILYVNKIGE